MVSIKSHNFHLTFEHIIICWACLCDQIKRFLVNHKILQFTQKSELGRVNSKIFSTKPYLFVPHFQGIDKQIKLAQT